MLGKKSKQKSAKKLFLYSHEYRDQKWGKNARNNFSRSTRIVREKYVGGKNRRKEVRKYFFYFHTNIETKKWGGGKRAKQFIQKINK